MDTKSDTVTLINKQGQKDIFSPRQAVKEGITLYQSDILTVSAGDKIRFTKSDTEQGFLAHSVWQIHTINDKTLILNNGKQTRTINPTTTEQHKHIDLAYAITTHASQGASQPFTITLVNTAGHHKTVSHSATYVALSRAKIHVQVYTNCIEHWASVLKKPTQKATLHDVVEQKETKRCENAKALLKQGKALESLVQGRAILQASRLSGKNFGKILTREGKYPRHYLTFPVFDHNGKKAGIWMATFKDAKSPLGQHTNEKVIGSQQARFLAFQLSQNNKAILVNTVTDAVKMATHHPEYGVVVRLTGNDKPYNPKALTGAQYWVKQPQETTAHLQKKGEESARKIVNDFGKKTDTFPVFSSQKADMESLKTSSISPSLLHPEHRKVLEVYQQESSGEVVKTADSPDHLKKPLQKIERDMVRNINKEKILGE